MRYSYIHSVLAPLSKCCPHLEGRLLTRYSPVRHLVFTEINTPFDLHVLSTPPAFVLSQDQTLQKNYFSKNRFGSLLSVLKEINLGNLLKSRYRTFVYVRKHICALFSFQRTFVAGLKSQLVYLNSLRIFCQELFYLFLKFFSNIHLCVALSLSA